MEIIVKNTYFPKILKTWKRLIPKLKISIEGVRHVEMFVKNLGVFISFPPSNSIVWKRHFSEKQNTNPVFFLFWHHSNNFCQHVTFKLWNDLSWPQEWVVKKWSLYMYLSIWPLYVSIWHNELLRTGVVFKASWSNEL